MKGPRLVLVSLIVVLIGWFAWRQYQGRRPTRYLIADGFRGVIRVEFGAPGASLAPTEGEFTLIRIPASGITRVANQFAYGLGDPDEYFYEGRMGRVRLYTGGEPIPIGQAEPPCMIHGPLFGKFPEFGNRTVECIFVGTDKEFKDYATKGQLWWE